MLVDKVGEPAGKTTQTDTSSNAQSRQVAGAAERKARARSPSPKTAYPSAFSQTSILQLARSLGVCSKRLSCCEWAFGWAVASLSSGWLLSRGAAGAFCAERGVGAVVC